MFWEMIQINSSDQSDQSCRCFVTAYRSKSCAKSKHSALYPMKAISS